MTSTKNYRKIGRTNTAWQRLEWQYQGLCYKKENAHMKKQKAPEIEMTIEQFFDKYYFRFIDYCKIRFSGAEIEGLVEDAFLSLWKHWEQLNSHAEFVLFVWTKKAIHLIAKAQYRKRAQEPLLVELDEQADAASGLQREEDGIIEQETYRQYIDQINERLSPSDRRLFDCYIIKEMSVRQTAQALSKSEKAVSVGLVRLRVRLRDRILPEILTNTSFP